MDGNDMSHGLLAVCKMRQLCGVAPVEDGGRWVGWQENWSAEWPVVSQ
jgi:hypothetical protein